MFTPFTDPEHYYKEEIYEKEKTTVFSKTWQFACLFEQVKQHNDFVTFNLVGTEIVVQNFQGKIKAFRNVCSHRYSKIQTESHGSRLLSCPYHGWTYNQDGVPIGIPCKNEFENLNPKNFSLKSYSIEVVGAFVFINLSENPLSFKEYLGDLFERFQDIAQAVGKIVNIHEDEVECNWKVIVENSLEGYHSDYVHPTSISQYYAANPTQPTPPCIYFIHPPHSYTAAELGAEQKKKWDKIKPLLGRFSFSIDRYNQYNIFPNFNIATFYGNSFFFQIFRPLSAQKTKLIHYSVESIRSHTNPKSDILYQNILEKSTEIGKKVLEEDIGVCIKVQEGISQAMRKGILNLWEQRVYIYIKSRTLSY